MCRLRYMPWLWFTVHFSDKYPSCFQYFSSVPFWVFERYFGRKALSETSNGSMCSYQTPIFLHFCAANLEPKENFANLWTNFLHFQHINDGTEIRLKNSELWTAIVYQLNIRGIFPQKYLIFSVQIIKPHGVNLDWVTKLNFHSSGEVSSFYYCQ